MRNATTGILLSLIMSCCAAPWVMAADPNVDVDNTRQNVRDRSEPTAQDQSNRKSAVKLTAELRRAIMKEKGLSMNAKNIKIINEDGCVFLRGPVDSLQEKQAIDALAAQCCGTGYRNELEVKTGQ